MVDVGVVAATQAVTFAVSTALGLVLGMLKRANKRTQAFERGMKAVLRKDLVDAYDKYVVEGKPLTVERKHELTESYMAYADLGGNGTGKDMFDALSEVPLTIVR